MRAAVRERYGAPGEVVQLRHLDVPTPAADEVLVRVRASSVNIAEWYAVTGRPWIARFPQGVRRPKETRIGVDFAGVVEAVGADVTSFRPGDEVFGGRTGAFADYVCVREERAVVLKPPNVTFQQTAAVPTAAVTALQALRDKGGLQPGQRVLVNGASGGVGTFTVSIAKALGAEVTAVCSTRNVEQARALGADRVLDYSKEDFASSERGYDLLVDIAGTRPWSACRKVLAPDATVVVVGGPRASRLLGPLGHIAGMRLGAVRASQRVVFFVAEFNKPDLLTLADLLGSGDVVPLVDRAYPLEELAQALEHQGGGHPASKVVVTM